MLQAARTSLKTHAFTKKLGQRAGLVVVTTLSPILPVEACAGVRAHVWSCTGFSNNSDS